MWGAGVVAGGLDYYLLRGPGGGGLTTVGGLTVAVLVEEFVRGRDHTTVGLRSAMWTAEAARWRDSAAVSKGLRKDPEAARERMRVVSRSAAEEVFRRLGAGELPSEAELRGCFRATESLGGGAPLLLSPGPDAKRIYRVLFLPAEEPERRPAGERAVGGHWFGWELRLVGGGIAWALDVTVRLAGEDDAAVGPVLAELTAEARRLGLIPVTMERFA